MSYPRSLREGCDLGCVLRLAIAEGPVLLLDLDKTDEDVFLAHARRLRESICDRLVELLLLLDGAAFVPGDLDDDEIIGAGDAEIVRGVLEIVGIVLIDDLEAVVHGPADAEHRVIDGAADLLAIGRILALAKVDTNEWH